MVTMTYIHHKTLTRHVSATAKFGDSLAKADAGMHVRINMVATA